MKRYKLTDQNMRTYNGFPWELNKEVITDGSGKLCSKGWLHCYSHPLLAVLLNPTHASIQNPRLFEADCKGYRRYDNGLKEGWTKMTLVKEIDIPMITINQKIAFSILCTLEVYSEASFVKWANNWLTNIDRTCAAANTAYTAAAYTAKAAYAAAYAAYAATNTKNIKPSLSLIKLAKKALTYR